MLTKASSKASKAAQFAVALIVVLSLPVASQPLTRAITVLRVLEGSGRAYDQQALISLDSYSVRATEVNTIDWVNDGELRFGAARELSVAANTVITTETSDGTLVRNLSLSPQFDSTVARPTRDTVVYGDVFEASYPLLMWAADFDDSGPRAQLSREGENRFVLRYRWRGRDWGGPGAFAMTLTYDEDGLLRSMSGVTWNADGAASVRKWRWLVNDGRMEIWAEWPNGAAFPAHDLYFHEVPVSPADARASALNYLMLSMTHAWLPLTLAPMLIPADLLPAGPDGQPLPSPWGVEVPITDIEDTPQDHLRPYPNPGPY